LVSRLLGELPGVLGVREPRLLRDLAISPPEVRHGYIGAIAKLMSRTFAEKELACVKATSFASEIAPELVPAGERVLFLYARLRNYIASILAGESSGKEMHSLAASRAERLASRGIGFPSPRNDADLAAIAWTCEMTSIEAATQAMPDRQIASADFDAMLRDMPAELARAATFFGFGVSDEQLAAIANGPLMQRYSKALQYEYSPRLREQLIAQALHTHGRDIDDALAMLRAAAEKSPLLTRALNRAGD
jgi:hypothetical protein